MRSDVRPSSVIPHPKFPHATHRARGYDSSCAICQVRTVQSTNATEFYLTATPGDASPQHQTEELYGQIAAVLREHDAAIVQERLFASSDALTTALACRAKAYGDLDDGVQPTLLRTTSQDRPIAGVQVHAVRGSSEPKVIHSAGQPLARRFECDGYRYLIGSGLRAPQLEDGPAQARAAFELAEDLLTQAGAILADVARTWIWMDDILGWYPQLNEVRNRFFRERGLMGSSGSAESVPSLGTPGEGRSDGSIANHKSRISNSQAPHPSPLPEYRARETSRMPASTGIGVSPAGARMALDLVAVWGQPDSVARFHSAGNQRSAYEYGSAFARAARAKTPGGTTLYCSGTAAIDARGNTCFPADAEGQVRMTVENVLAVLRDLGCGSEDVVQAMAYCATPQARECFLNTYAKALGWPCLTLIGDVCRHDLLFEIEVTAGRNHVASA